MTALPDPLDDVLLAAHRCGMVVVYRGEWPSVEIDVVKAGGSTEDDFADACGRAFREGGDEEQVI